jgi:hypothetical protein
MSEERYKRLGSEKQKDVNISFDTIHEKYRLKALVEGYSGELKFVKEKGRVIIFVEIG